LGGDGERVDLKINKVKYSLFKVGDMGRLTHCGSTFVNFDDGKGNG
jgi:hypothetical protein